MDHSPMDEWLKERLDQYDQWLAAGKIPFSSKVVPVNRSLEARQWVLPAERVLQFLKDARSFSVSPCVCRTHYGRCDAPVDVCFSLDGVADRLVDRGEARRLSLEEAREILDLANEHGLVHLTLHNPEQYPYAICSCCRCCCHDLQMLLDHGRKDLVARSEYVAVQDRDLCTDCGICADRCVFGTRTLENGVLSYDPELCYGCGLCVDTCPADAIELVAKPRTGSQGAVP